MGVDPLVHAYLVHYQLEAIHPFSDGNGRVGRLLLALMTGLGCGLQMPWLYMSAFFERHRDTYIDRLFDVSAKGAWSEWIRFCIAGTAEQTKDAIHRCDLLRQARREMNELVSSGSGRLHAIVERLFSVPVLTIPSVRDAFGVTYPTAKADVLHLVRLGILRELPRRGRPKAFFAPRVFAIAYGNPEDLARPEATEPTIS